MADLRTRLNQEIDGRSDDEIKTLVDAVFAGGSKRMQKWFYCPHCTKSFQQEILIPDAGKNIEALTKLLDQAKGKPAETRRVEVDITARTVSELEELSDAQLAELAAAEEGQWELLPASEGA